MPSWRDIGLGVWRSWRLLDWRPIRRQAETLGWPVSLTADALTDEELQKAFDYCLTEPARTKARDCCVRAMKALQETRDEFISALTHAGERKKA